MSISVLRSMTQYNPKRGDVVAVLGVGALGSKMAMEFACLGVKEMIVADFDVVEEHNLGNQFYFPADIGKQKAEAIAELIAAKTAGGCEVTQLGKIDASNIEDIREATHIFLAFDSFDARIDVLHAIIDSKMLGLTFDARLGAYHGNTAFVGDELVKYVAWLEKMRDERVEPETSACGLPISLGFTSSVIAGIAVANFVQHCNDQLVYNSTEINLASLIETGSDSPWEE